MTLSLTRRGLWRLLLGSAALGLGQTSLPAAPIDQGIGGTGAAPSKPETGDRGIGGTGVVGTIRKFGSIYVNDLRIAYPDSVAVRIDGQPARVSDLRIGQVVRVVANGGAGAYSTREIDITSEVAGPIQSVSTNGLVILGQKVATDELGNSHEPWSAGNFVAVYGLRRQDGAIVASLITPRPRSVIRLAGPVIANAAGAPVIGGLELVGLDPALIGQRAVVTGRLADNRLMVSTGVSEEALLARSGARQYLIEGYVARRGGGLELGSGLRVLGSDRDAPVSGAVRAVVHAVLGSQGVFSVRSLRPIAAFTGPGRGDGRLPGGRGPGGRNQGPRNTGGGLRGGLHGVRRGIGNLFRRPGNLLRRPGGPAQGGRPFSRGGGFGPGGPGGFGGGGFGGGGRR